MSYRKYSIALSGQVRVRSYCTGCLCRNEILINNARFYGSPLVKCRHCGMEYIEETLHEPAIDGIDPASSDAGKLKKIVTVCLVITAVSVLICILATSEHTMLYTFGLTFAAIFGVTTIGFAATLLKVKSGKMEEENKRLLEESDYRLISNREYAEKLKSFGYNVPEKYLK